MIKKYIGIQKFSTIVQRQPWISFTVATRMDIEISRIFAVNLYVQLSEVFFTVFHASTLINLLWSFMNISLDHILMCLNLAARCGDFAGAVSHVSCVWNEMMDFHARCLRAAKVQHSLVRRAKLSQHTQLTVGMTFDRFENYSWCQQNSTDDERLEFKCFLNFKLLYVCSLAVSPSCGAQCCCGEENWLELKCFAMWRDR